MYDDDDVSLSSDSETCPPQIERRHYHNLLEKNRRNILKCSFSKLKNAVPSLAKKNSMGASRAKILRRSIEFIRRSELKRSAREKDIMELKAENKLLEDQIRAMECVSDSTGLSSIQTLLQRIQDSVYKVHSEELTDSGEEDDDDSDTEGLESESRYSEDDYDSPPKTARRKSPEEDFLNGVNTHLETCDTLQLDVTTSDSETATDSEVEEN